MTHKSINQLLKSFIVFCAIFIAGSGYLYSEVKIAPYYALQVAEGTTIPTKGDWMFSINLASDLGLIVQTDEKHRFIGFYELKYSGPGLRRQEGEKFTDRLMDHIIVLRHHYNLLPDYILKSQIDYMTEYKRTGTNEIWSKGLYDFNRYGLGITLERKFDEDLSASLCQQYHFLDFPNYTDLLSEFQSGGESVESSTGKQNHGLYQTGLTVSKGPSKISADFLLMAYEKQKVIVDAIQPNKTYYSSALQRDIVFSVGFEHQKKIREKISLSPSLTLKTKTSNQNYQHFTVSNSTVPVKYIEGYYDYNEINISVPSSVLLSEKWDFFFNPEWDMKFYLNRPPRDENNNFVSGKQGNDLVILSMGFTYKPNEITRTTLFYTFQSQTSNMKFEKYLPYNYGGHFFGIGFNYVY